MEKFVIPLVWAAPGTALVLLEVRGAEKELSSARSPGMMVGVEKQMRTVCLSKQCFFFKIGLPHPLS